MLSRGGLEVACLLDDVQSGEELRRAGLTGGSWGFFLGSGVRAWHVSGWRWFDLEGGVEIGCRSSDT